MNKVSNREKEKLTEMTEAMSPEEQKAVVSGLPTQLLYEELGVRLETKTKFISRIVEAVQETT